jgi:hypothetical protein
MVKWNVPDRPYRIRLPSIIANCGRIGSLGPQDREALRPFRVPPLDNAVNGVTRGLVDRMGCFVGRTLAH